MLRTWKIVGKELNQSIISLQKSTNESSKIICFADQTITDPWITAEIQKYHFPIKHL